MFDVTKIVQCRVIEGSTFYFKLPNRQYIGKQSKYIKTLFQNGSKYKKKLNL